MSENSPGNARYIAWSKVASASWIGELRILRRSCAFCSQGFGHELLQYLFVHVTKLLDIEASFPGGVLAQLSEQRLRTTESHEAVQNCCRLAGREREHRHVALASAVVLVVTSTHPDDRSAPQFGFFTGKVFHPLDQQLRVFLLGGLRDLADKCGHTRCCGFGFAFSHFLTPKPLQYTPVSLPTPPSVDLAGNPNFTGELSH